MDRKKSKVRHAVIDQVGLGDEGLETLTREVGQRDLRILRQSPRDLRDAAAPHPRSQLQDGMVHGAPHPRGPRHRRPAAPRGDAGGRGGRDLHRRAGAQQELAQKTAGGPQRCQQGLRGEDPEPGDWLGQGQGRDAD